MLSGLRAKFKHMVFMHNTEIKDSNSGISVPNTYTTCAISPEKIMVENEQFRDIVFGVIRNIKDPEKPSTLEDLNVVYEDGVQVTRNFDNTVFKVLIEFTPTVPHCSLASLIVIKQINDKERVAAAMEIGGLKEVVAKCISEDD